MHNLRGIYARFQRNPCTKPAVEVHKIGGICNLIIKGCEELGVSQDEIFISTVYYVNKSIPFCTFEPFPFEFFLKDTSFSNQSEFRILIASKNTDFYKNLQIANNTIMVGDISSFTVLQDIYHTDLHFSIQRNHIIYNLSKPITLTLDERDFTELVNEIYQIFHNKLPEGPKDKTALDAYAKLIASHLKLKYGVEFRDDRKLYNVPRDRYKALPELLRKLCVTVV